MALGAEHGNVSAVRMSNECQVSVVRVRLQFLQLADHKQDVCLAAFIDGLSAHIRQTYFGYQGRVGRKILLNTRHKESSCRENVSEEGIFGVSDRVAIADNGNRELPIAGIRLH